MKVQDEYKDFLVINTHKGLYRYNVLPQGIASSPAVFQEFVDQILRDIPNAGSFIDDCIATGNSDADHLKTLRKIVLKMRECNYKLSKEKCEFMKSSIEFLGHQISKQGIQTSPKKVADILWIPAPLDVHIHWQRTRVNKCSFDIPIPQIYNRYFNWLKKSCF